jgi:hypothetical protein
MDQIKAESSDIYGGVVAVLNTRWRVVSGRCGLQWVLQRRVTKDRPLGNNWEGMSFCRTKEAIIRRSREKADAIDPAAMAVLEQLPIWFPEEPHQTPAETAVEACQSDYS